MKIKALVPFSNGTISMEQYEVKEVTDSLGNELISAGIAVEIGGGGLPPVTASDAGKVLSVDNSGVWGASGDIELTGVFNDGGVTITTNPLPSEDVVKQAYESNRRVSITLADGQKFMLEPFTKYDSTVTGGNAINYVFAGTGTDFDGLEIKRAICGFAFYTDGTPTTCGASITYDNPFIVTLTPTAQDFSGTMDKTVAEINAAYEAGQQIWFKVLTSASTAVEIPLTYWATDSSYEYNGFAANLVNVASNVLIVAYVGSTSDGTRQTYDTKVYPLTPAT